MTCTRRIQSAAVITAHAKAIGLHNFGSIQTDGSAPEGPVAGDRHGNILGTTFDGGTRHDGVVFELAAPPHGDTGFAYSIIYNFTGGTDGGLPASPLTVDQHGTL
jgi:hypothetical protein